MDYEVLKRKIHEMIACSAISTNYTSSKNSINNAQFTCLFIMFYLIIGTNPTNLEELNKLTSNSIGGYYSLNRLIAARLKNNQSIETLKDYNLNLNIECNLLLKKNILPRYKSQKIFDNFINKKSYSSKIGGNEYNITENNK